MYTFDTFLGPSRILDFVYFLYIFGICPGLSKSLILYMFCIFQDSQEYLSVTGTAQCKTCYSASLPLPGFHPATGIAPND